MSQYSDLLTAAQSVTMALPGFAGLGSAIRSRPFCSTEHGDTLPFVCFSPGLESVGDENFDRGVRMWYPILVTIFREKGPAYEDAAAIVWKLDRREEVRSALWEPRVLADSQIDCTYDPRPPWDFSALDKVFDVSTQLFTFANDEER